MAAALSHRYRPGVIVVATVAVLVLALAGCGKSGAGTATATGTPAAGVGGLNPVDGSPAASATPSDSAGPTAGPSTAAYPGDAKAYAQAALDAWASGAHAGLVALTSPAAATGFDHITSHPDMNWHFHTCEGAAGSQYCMWDNNNGDRLRIKVISQYVGQAHAIDEVVLDATTYPSIADDYAGAFMQAWLDGNSYRMTALSAATVTSYFTHYTAQATWTFADQGTAGHTKVRITNPDGFDQTVNVTNQYLGQPHAITEVCTTGCA